MAAEVSGSAVELKQAVRIFQDLVPPHAFNAREGVTRSMIYTPWIAAWMMVYQRLNAAASLADAVAELAGIDHDLLPPHKRIRQKTVSSNTGAYSVGRSRLTVEAAEDAADRVSDALITQSRAAATAGRSVIVVDGSTLTLTTADSLRQAYPPPKNQHGQGNHPAVRVVAAHDLGTGAMFRPEIAPASGPKAAGEVKMAGPLLRRLPKHSIVVADRNFGIFLMAWMTAQAGHDCLFRLTEVRFHALARKATAVGPGTWQLHWKPSVWDRKQHPDLPQDAAVSVQLHEVRICDRLTLWLATSLESTGADLAAIYHGRQEIETDLRNLKQTLRLDVLRSRSPEMVRKELAAASIAYNLVILVRKLAAAEAGVNPRRLSFARVHSVVKVFLLRRSAGALEASEAKDLIAQAIRMATQCKLPHRPGRSYPREAFEKRTKYPRRKIDRSTKQEK